MPLYLVYNKFLPLSKTIHDVAKC